SGPGRWISGREAEAGCGAAHSRQRSGFGGAPHHQRTLGAVNRAISRNYHAPPPRIQEESTDSEAWFPAQPDKTDDFRTPESGFRIGSARKEYGFSNWSRAMGSCARRTEPQISQRGRIFGGA